MFPFSSRRNIRRRDFAKRLQSLAAVDLSPLRYAGIQGFILDLDNTIISEDDRYVSPGAEAWIKRAKLQGFKLFILSNGKRHYRVKYWSDRLGIPAINPAWKPFPLSFHKALKSMLLQPNQVIVIGDSNHTDNLGAWLSGCSFIQVASLPHPSRWWEKWFGRWLQTPYPVELELWQFDFYD